MITTVKRLGIEFRNYFATNIRMAGRPPKDPSQRKGVDLRIPVTVDQKRLVNEAMALDHREFAAWARELILTNAQSLIEASPKKRPRKRS